MAPPTACVISRQCRNLISNGEPYLAVTVESILKLLKQYDPYDKTCKSSLPVIKLDGADYTLHVDMSPHNKDFGHMWEWWLENSTDGFVDGGFEPANDDPQLLNLAAIIHGALQKSCGIE
jgi:hypothetical protein